MDLELRRWLKPAAFALVSALLVFGLVRVVQLGQTADRLSVELARVRAELDDVRTAVRATESSVGTAIDGLGSRLSGVEESQQTAQEQNLDAGVVSAEIAPAVFTLSNGQSFGTGFGIHSDGSSTWIATNYHVVRGASEVGVVHGMQRYVGSVTAGDEQRDVALVEVRSALPVLEIASASGNLPEVGDPVLAYGSPYGLEGTATEGIISALRRGWIQTDAQINPGNSGGPLVNNEGQVLGITTAGAGSGGSGVGFAIDVDVLCTTLFQDGRC
jgi:S1-C subfamily serine protease